MKKLKLTHYLFYCLIVILLSFLVASSSQDPPNYQKNTDYSNESPDKQHLPQAGLKTSKTPILLTKQIVYAYSSRVSETDGDPFTTANGTKVREGIIANNCWPFGSRVRIYDGSGGKNLPQWYLEPANGWYTLEDRMNERHGCNHWDIWLADTQQAIDWGHKILTLAVYE